MALAVALFGRRDHPKDTKWVIWGALMPDLPMFVLFAIDKARGIPMDEIWRVRYFQDDWQIPINAFNSIPIYALILGLAYWRKSRAWMVFALAALLHILFDLPVHREDEHAHFWPLSNWKFISPVSYWDPAHYGNIVAVFEFGILAICAVLGVRVFVHRWAKWIYVLACLFMPLAFLGFYLWGWISSA